MTCPQCGEECTRDEVDVGTGSIAASPWGCENCGWVEHDSGPLSAERIEARENDE